MKPESVSPGSMSPGSMSLANMSLENMGPDKNTPALRFKGFEGEWEERKLGEVGQIVTGGTPPTSLPEYYAKDGVLWVTPTDICENVTLDSARKLSSLGEQVCQVIPKDSILVTCIASIGKNTLLGERAGFNQQINGLTPDMSSYDPYFLLTESTFWSAHMKKSAPAGTMQIINRTAFSEIQTLIPSYREQKQIGVFYSQLDHLLSLQADKLEKLQSFKNAMLEKMFPQKGSKVPEIRFKGFTGEWENCKVKDLCTIETGKSNTQDQVANGDYPFYIRSDIPVRSDKLLYDCEAVITIGDGNIGKVFHYVNGKFDLHQRCYKMADFHEIWGKFFYYYFSTHFYNRAIRMTAKATVDSVRLDMISEMNILKPVQLEEQKALADYFSQLDHLISLQALKLTKLKGLKKALLEGMFPLPKI